MVQKAALASTTPISKNQKKQLHTMLTLLLPDDGNVEASTKQEPLPMIECRPHPQAAQLIPPAVRVLILGIHLQHWRSHLGEPWARHQRAAWMSSTREAVPTRVRTQLRTFLNLGKVRKKITRRIQSVISTSWNVRRRE